MAADKAGLSLGKSKKVCGYEIRKMPVGAYLRAMGRIKDLPSDFLETCFPGQSLQRILDDLTTIDENGIKALAAGALIAAPRYIIGLIAELTGINEETLINDENIGADGLIAIAAAFIEVNRLGECAAGVKKLRQAVKALA